MSTPESNTAPDALFGAIEGGGTKFLCAVADARGREYTRTSIPTRTPDDTLEAVGRFFAPYRGRLERLGVACFGPLSLRPGPDHGSLLATPKPGWTGIPLRARLEAELGTHVTIDTDVNGAAIAERRWGALAGTESCAYVTVGTGVGVGVLIDGKPLHGILHPELGHLRSHDPSFQGACPFHGHCIEGLVSAPAIHVRTGLEAHALPAGHPVWTQVARTLAELLQAIVLAYAPERIVIGGGVLQRDGLRALVQRGLHDALAGYVPREELSWPAITRYVVAPGLGAQSGLMGAFALAGLTLCPAAGEIGS